MAAKKQAAPPKEQKHKNPSIQVRIDRLNDYEGSSVKAFASANIGGAFAIHGIRVVDSQKGLFVSMPQNSYKDGNQQQSQRNVAADYELLQENTLSAKRRNPLERQCVVFGKAAPSPKQNKSKQLTCQHILCRDSLSG